MRTLLLFLSFVLPALVFSSGFSYKKNTSHLAPATSLKNFKNQRERWAIISRRSVKGQGNDVVL
jgi:hypothetical protein